MCISKCVAGYIWTYPDLCRDLRRHLRLRLNRDLYRNPYHKPHAALNRASFQKPLEKPNPMLFHWLHGLKYRQLYDLANLALYRET